MSRLLNIHEARLNDICLEDVELQDAARQDLHDAVCEMYRVKETLAGGDLSDGCEDGLMPCTSYWVEDSDELVLYVWNEFLAKTIVVPKAQWGLRRDITLN